MNLSIMKVSGHPWARIMTTLWMPFKAAAGAKMVAGSKDSPSAALWEQDEQ